VVQSGKFFGTNGTETMMQQQKHTATMAWRTRRFNNAAVCARLLPSYSASLLEVSGTR
jgi:hypothetical protein